MQLHPQPYPEHSADLQPDLDEVLQSEAPLACMPVRIEGPVRTQPLPTKGAGGKTWPAVGTKPIQILTADPYRASATLLSFDQTMIIAFRRTDSTDDVMVTYWPKLVPFTLRARTDVWVASATATTMLSLYQERWAESE